MQIRKALILLVGLGLACFATAQTQQSLTSQMGISQNLGAKVPADAVFKDETNKQVTFGSYLSKRPVLLIPIFYNCQTGCPLITDGLVQTLHAAASPTGLMRFSKGADRPLKLGKDLEVVMLSIDPRETPELAADKKAFIMDRLGDSAGIEHWHLLTGTLGNIRKLTDAIGYSFYYRPASKDPQVAKEEQQNGMVLGGIIRHPNAAVILTPNGTISSYNIGNEFPTKFLESELALAARNQVGEKADQSFMFGCVVLDPATGKIRFVVENIVRVACVATLLFMGGAFYRSIRNERRSALAAGGSA